MERVKRDWPKIMREWQSSNLSPEEFCKANKIYPSLFYKWRRRFSDSALKKPSSKKPEFVEIPISPQPITSKTIAHLKITLTNGCTIEVPL